MRFEPALSGTNCQTSRAASAASTAAAGIQTFFDGSRTVICFDVCGLRSGRVRVVVRQGLFDPGELRRQSSSAL